MRRVLLCLALLLFASPAFAQVAISNLPTATAPLGSEPVPLVQKGVTRKATVASIGFPRDYIDGFTLSTGGGTIVFSVAPGVATDTTGLARASLTSSLSKTTAPWAQGTGTGALDTGVIAVSTWYHVFAILNPSTGVTDILVSASPTAPTMPSGFIYKRRIGSMKTNGAGNWTAFLQRGDRFYWAASVRDANTTPTSGATNVVQLTVPTGVQVEAIVNGGTTQASAGATALTIWDPALSSSAPAAVIYAASGLSAEVVHVFTDTSAFIDTMLTYGGAVSYTIDTLGWRDPRGKDS